MMMMPRHRTLKPLCLLILGMEVWVVQSKLCLLCEAGVNGLQRPNFPINKDGTTCVDKALDMSMNHFHSSKSCKDDQEAFREVCCDEDEPEQVFVDPTPAPHTSYVPKDGEFDPCPICYNEEFPGDPSMVLNMLNLGAGSCRQYYFYGLDGNIPHYLCSTLQFFAFDPCGCGKTQGGNGGSTTIGPTEAPLPCHALLNRYDGNLYHYTKYYNGTHFYNGTKYSGYVSQEDRLMEGVYYEGKFWECDDSSFFTLAPLPPTVSPMPTVSSHPSEIPTVTASPSLRLPSSSPTMTPHPTLPPTPMPTKRIPPPTPPPVPRPANNPSPNLFCQIMPMFC